MYDKIKTRHAILKGGDKLKITTKAARVNANLTQEQLAEKMGVSRLTVICWETGKREMRTPYVHLFCNIVGVSEDDILLP